MTKQTVMGWCLMLTAVMCQAGDVVVQQQGLSAPTKDMRYFDGKQWRDIWRNENEVAEFLPVPRAKSQMRSLLPGARLSRTGKRVKIWRIDELENATTLNKESKRRAVIGDAPRSTFSPVFHRSARGGPKMALGGGVIVRFKPAWTDEMIADWAALNELTLLKVLNAEVRTYVYEAGAGMVALEKANAIQQAGEVEFAMPEWWRGVHKR